MPQQYIAAVAGDDPLAQGRVGFVHRDARDQIALPEVQAPIARHLGGRQLRGQALVFVFEPLVRGDFFLPRAVELRGRHALLGRGLDVLDQRTRQRVGVGPFVCRREADEQGVVLVQIGAAVGRDRDLAVDHEVFAQRAPIVRADGIGSEVEREGLAVELAGHLPAARDQRAAGRQREFAAVGDGARLFTRPAGDGRRVRILGLREQLRGQGQHALLVELAGHDERGVVGAVVLLVEGLQRAERRVFDVAARTDGRAPVAMPEPALALQRAHHEAVGAGVTALQLVAHDGHFALQVLLREAGSNEAIGLDAQGRVDLVGLGRHGLEEVGAIGGGRAVPARAQGRQVALDVGALARALEQHVFEQVSHAGLAIAFELAAGLDEQLDARRGRRRVRRQDDLEAIGQAVRADAGGLRVQSRAGWQRRWLCCRLSGLCVLLGPSHAGSRHERSQQSGHQDGALQGAVEGSRLCSHVCLSS